MRSRPIVLFVCITLLLPACAPKQASLHAACDGSTCSEFLVSRVEYTSRGLPVFHARIANRPSQPGDRFSVVQLRNGMAAVSYDIVVAGTESDLMKPFRVVYEWTGKGFEFGAQGTMVMTEGASHGVRIHGNANSRDSGVVLAIVFAPLLIGTAGAFVIGVADGVRTAAEEVGKVVLGKQEQIAAYTTYTYDERNRMVVTRMYQAADQQEEVVRTEFSYQGEAREPVKTRVTARAADGTRTIEY